MSNSENKTQRTQHAFLVAWGWFGEHLGGLAHLQDISLAAHPLDKDQAVAEAWEQPGWALVEGDPGGGVSLICAYWKSACFSCLIMQ